MAKVVIRVKRHAVGNKLFTGYQEKYPKLFNIASGDDFETKIEQEDYDEVKKDLLAGGVACHRVDGGDAPKKADNVLLDKLLGFVETDEKPEKKWAKIMKAVSKETVAFYKNFEPKKAKPEELESKIDEVLKSIQE
jgi:hypothetical protein